MNNNLAEFWTDTILMTLLFISLASFLAIIVSTNNPTALGADLTNVIDSISTNVKNNMSTYESTFSENERNAAQGVLEDADGVGSYIGSISVISSAQSVSSQTKLTFFESIKLIYYVFNSEAGSIILGTMVSLWIVSLLVLGWQFIKQGR